MYENAQPKGTGSSISNIVAQVSTRHNFISFIWKNKANRLYLLIALTSAILQFIVFKLLYPYPDFFSDSYSYLYAAYANLNVSIWPIGYSKFLRAFHYITSSDTALIAFQYLFLVLGALYFFFTNMYFFRPRNNGRLILFLFLFFNPLYLYLCNYVNSDPLFVAISIYWFTQLIWIINKPSVYQLLTHSILLFLAFTIRNNAYYYPIVSCAAFILSRQPVRIKLAGIFLPFLMIIPFIIHSRGEAYKLTGTHQFSLFTGWQLANNALYMYRDIDVDPDDLPTQACRQLDSLSKSFYATTTPAFGEVLNNYVGNYFIRQPESPLKKYIRQHYKIKNGMDDIIVWGKASADFEQYGKHLIYQQPVAYIKDFVIPNVRFYFLPPLEKMEDYNLGSDQVETIAVRWFKLKSKTITSVSRNVQGTILFLFPSLFLFVNICLLGCLIWQLLKKGPRQIGQIFNRPLLLTCIFLLANFLFCITATIIVLRYEIFPLIVCGTYALLLAESVDLKFSTSGSNPLIPQI